MSDTPRDGAETQAATLPPQTQDKEDADTTATTETRAEDGPVEEDKQTVCLGIDLGSDTIVVGELLSTGAVQLKVTDTGSRSIPPAVSFQGKRRYLGQQARDCLSSNPHSTIVDVVETLEPQARATPSFVAANRDAETGNVLYSITYENASSGSKDLSLPSRDVLAMLLTHVLKSFQLPSCHYHIVLAVPDAYGQCALRAVEEACAIAVSLSPNPSSTTFAIAPASSASVRRYNQQHAKNPVANASASNASPAKSISKDESRDEVADEREERKRVVIADVGKAFTSVAVYAVNEATQGLFEEALAHESLHFGCNDLDMILYDIVSEKLQAKGLSADAIKLGTRRSLRILRECASARKILSANKQVNVVFEAFGENDESFSFEVSRALFESKCASLMAELAVAVTRALETSRTAPEAIKYVELVGGATCVPMVQETIASATNIPAQTAVGSDSDDASKAAMGQMRVTLDRSSCAAIGATLLAGDKLTSSSAAHQDGHAALQQVDVSDITARDNIKAACNMLQAMQTQDDSFAQIGHARNLLEGYVFTTRNYASGEHKALFNETETTPLLEEALSWLAEHDMEDTSVDEYVSRFDDLKNRVEAINKDFFAAKQAEETERERRREAEAALRAQERAKEDTVDNDHRKLPFSKRMNQVQRNKQEATELFKDGNYSHATARYVRALGLTSKFFDMSSDQQAEVSAIKTVLHLNLAMCYLKQSLWKKAAASCDEALVSDPENPKAYYRKATALENMKDLSEALKLAKKGQKHAAEGDTAFAKLIKRIEGKKKQQLQKEKKMYAKMFG